MQAQVQVQVQVQVRRCSPSKRRGVSVSAVEQFLSNGRMRWASETWKIAWGGSPCDTPGVHVHNKANVSLQSTSYYGT
jgi:hypothetical protein